MTKPRDPVTGSDELNPKQLEAINLLCTGLTQVATAETIKVHRVTLSNWFRKDPRFRAELNRRLQERAEATRIRVQSLVETSLEILEESIKNGRDPKAAGAFLRLVGSQGFLGTPPSGPTTFEEAAMQMTIEEEHQNSVLKVVLAKTAPAATRPNFVDAVTPRLSGNAQHQPRSVDGKIDRNGGEP